MCSQRAEPGRAAPGQDLSLLPTSSPCAAAKPPLGKGLNFWFWPSSVSPPCVIMLHKLKKQRRASEAVVRWRRERESERKEGEMKKKKKRTRGDSSAEDPCSIKTAAAALKTLAGPLPPL